MYKEIETEIKVFIDGFGGMAVVDFSKTHKDIIQYLKEESIWEVLDGVQSNKRGTYLSKFSFHYEDNFPEQGAELVINESTSTLISVSLPLTK